MLEKEGSCCCSEAPAVTGDKLVTPQAAEGQGPHPGWHRGAADPGPGHGPGAQPGLEVHWAADSASLSQQSNLSIDPHANSSAVSLSLS